MTMPHLMNCPHQGEGWCLDCVGRLRAEADRRRGGAAALRNLISAAAHASAVIGHLNTHDAIVRELNRAGQADALAGALKFLNEASARAGATLSPRRPSQGDFKEWMAETFFGRDHDMQVDPVPNPVVLTKEQAMLLADYIAATVELLPPSRLERLREAGDRRDWDRCDEIESEGPVDDTPSRSDVLAWERWRCCCVICEGCREGWAYLKETDCHRRPDGTAAPCEAVAIRALGERS